MRRTDEHESRLADEPSETRAAPRLVSRGSGQSPRRHILSRRSITCSRAERWLFFCFFLFPARRGKGAGAANSIHVSLAAFFSTTWHLHASGLPASGRDLPMTLESAHFRSSNNIPIK
jgi:hypothetical protein